MYFQEVPITLSSVPSARSERESVTFPIPLITSEIKSSPFPAREKGRLKYLPDSFGGRIVTKFPGFAIEAILGSLTFNSKRFSAIFLFDMIFPHSLIFI